MPQVTDLTLPVGDAGADVLYAVIDKQNGVITWRQNAADVPVQQMERLTASITRPGGKRKNFSIQFEGHLPFTKLVDGEQVYSHANHVSVTYTVSPLSTTDEASHTAEVGSEFMTHPLIKQIVSELSGLF